MKSIIKSAIVFLVLFSGIRAMAAEDITARRILHSPVMDGKLDEAEWQQTKYADNFTRLGTTGGSLSKTRAAVLYDDNNLYIGIICKTTNGAAIKAEIHNDGDIFRDDEVEVMIAPRTGGEEYLQVGVNAAGSRFDAWVSEKGKKCDMSWTGDWQAAACTGKDEWSCELMIPFALLGVKEGAAAPWLINVCRHSTDPEEYSSLAANGSFNEPDKFTVLSGLEKIKVVSRAPVYRVIRSVAEIKLQDGKMGGVVRAFVTNESPVAGKATVRLEEWVKNERVRIGSLEIELRGSEGREIVFDSPVKLVPIEGGTGLWQLEKSLMVVVAGADAKQSGNELSVWPLVRPIHLSVIDRVKPELKCTTGFNDKGGKASKILVTVENIDAGGKAPAAREYPLADGIITADFQADKLPAGRLLARAVVKDAEGKAICTQELVFAHLNKEPERLNNLVGRLEQKEIKLGKDEKNEIIFENPRDGWVWVKIRTDSGGAGAVTVSAGGKEWMKITGGGETETMRWLPCGPHSLTISATADGQADYEIRTATDLCLYYYNIAPSQKNPIMKFGPYDEKYMKANGLLRNMNGMIITSVDGKNKTFAEEWARNGGRWFVHEYPPGRSDKKGNITAEYVFKTWSENALIKNDLTSGYWLDEFDTHDTSDNLERWAAGMRLMLADKRFENKVIYPYLTSRGAGRAHYMKFMDEIYGIGTYPAIEWYPPEEPTEEKAGEMFEEFRQRMRDYEKTIPGIMPHSLLVLCSASLAGRWTCDVYPDVDFKVFLDLQFNMIANHPLFMDLFGFQWYTSGHTDDETMRWCSALYRHYGIEGRRDKLSERYGFKYKLKHIANGDFDDGLKGWETKAGAEGTLAVREIKKFGQNQQGRWQAHEIGDHVLWMKRSAQGPNTAAQVVKGLEAGKLYSLKMVSGDYNELMAGKSIATNHILRVNIENVEIIPDESFVGLLKTTSMITKNPYYFDYHWTVFRAKGKEARLVISDWADEKNAGGPEGQELICNFIQVQPFFEKEQRTLQK